MIIEILLILAAILLSPIWVPLAGVIVVMLMCIPMLIVAIPVLILDRIYDYLSEG